MKNLLFAFCCLLLVIFRTEALAEEPSSFKVGVIQSLSGISVIDGHTVLNSLKLAAKDIEATRGEKVELIIEDDASDSKKTVTAFKRLEAQGLKVVIGSTWGFTTSTIIPLAEKSRIVLFNTSTFPEALGLGEKTNYTFSTATSARDEAQVLTTFLKHHPVKTMAIVYVLSGWGEVQRDAYLHLAKERGIQVLHVEPSQTHDVNEWGSAVLKIRALKPELVLLILNKEDLDSFLRRANEQKLDAKFFASKNLRDAFTETKHAHIYENVCFSYPQEQIEKEKEFNERYKSAYGELPLIYADNTYDTLFLVLEAMKKSKKGGAPLEEALETVTHEGVVGAYSYSKEKSFSAGYNSLVCVKDGKFELGAN